MGEPPEGDRFKLIQGPYFAPMFDVGESLTCEYRRQTVVIEGWTNAPIPWPAARPVSRSGKPAGGRLSPVVASGLAHAVRVESASAVAYWWGVAEGTVCRWRAALGVSDTPGSRRLRQRSSRKPEGFGEKIAAARREAVKSEPGGAVDPRRPAWSEEHLALLGAMPDARLAGITGRTKAAITCMRNLRGIPRCKDGILTPADTRRPWEPEEDAVLGTAPDAVVGRRLGRSRRAVHLRRKKLGIPPSGAKGKP